MTQQMWPHSTECSTSQEMAFKIGSHGAGAREGLVLTVTESTEQHLVKGRGDKISPVWAAKGVRRFSGQTQQDIRQLGVVTEHDPHPPKHRLHLNLSCVDAHDRGQCVKISFSFQEWIAATRLGSSALTH